MKTFLISSILQLLTLLAFAQVPQQFSFQGVAREASGKVVTSKNISVRASIIQNTILGPTVYRETHKPTTTSTGIFNLAIGGGSQEIGTLGDVDWQSGSYFLKIEVDFTGGENYVNIGTSQLVSVPYAIFSEKASNAYKTDEALYALEAGKWKDGNVVLQRGKLNEGPTLPSFDTGSVLLWYPRKAAFVTGYSDNNFLQDANIGKSSAGFGNFAKPTGSASFAAGHKSWAKGDVSFSMGQYTHAKANCGVAFGHYNDDQDDPSGTGFSWNDRLFQIGNGGSENQRSNALTILRNGKIGVGDVVDPEYILDIDGRPRLRHNGATSGLFFNTSQQNPNAFMGMKTDEQIGFFLAGEWRFWVDNNGNAKISGASYNTSDRRLKRDFTSLSNSLSTLTNLNGYHYYWKNANSDQGLQTGLIAQEVEELFPELVSTDKDGFKSVNYIGLIPHLIESMKELKAKVDRLEAENNR